MTRHGPALLALSVLAIAGWTYNVNYDTRAALDRLSDLRARIAEEREALQVLRVEWAYLNAPDRLARLTVEHNDRLKLVALKPEALGYVAAVPYPRGVPGERPGDDALIAAGPGSRAELAALAAAGWEVTPLPEEEPAGLTIAAGPEEGGIDTAALVPAEIELAGLAEEDGAAAEGAAAGGGGGTGVAEGHLAAPVPATATTDTALPAPAETVLAANDPVISAAVEKAGVISAPAEVATMQEAVTLALIEAGIVQPGAAPASGAATGGGGGAPVISASAGGGIPMPPARPASWARP